MPSSKHASDPFEEAFLNSYPNPGRVGCPGSEVLRGLATKELPISHPSREHIMQCSPCFREFRQFEREIKRERQRRLVWLTGLAAACLLIAVLVFRGWVQRVPEQTVATIPAKRTIDLSDVDANRGAAESGSHIQVGDLPPTFVELKVILPRFSRPGNYRIAICRERSADSAVADAKGLAISDGSREFVTVIVDLTKARKGQLYWLSTTHEQDDASYYFPIRIA
jgi:hypothetical protein